MGGFGNHGAMPSLLAEALGLTPDELSAALAEGKHAVNEMRQQNRDDLPTFKHSEA